MRYLLPLAGLVLLACALRAFRRLNTKATLLFALSYPPACVVLTLWPQQNAIPFDQLTHLPGLARLLVDIGATLTGVFQCAFALCLGDALSHRYRMLLTLCSSLLLVLASCWIFALRSAGSTLLHVAYGGYDGRTISLLVWNTMSGAITGFAYALALMGYSHVVRTASDRRTRLVAATILIVFGAGFLNAVLVIVQAWASHFGASANALWHIMQSLVVIAVILGIMINLTIFAFVPLWLRLRQLWSLQYRHAQLLSVRRDLTDAVVVLTDRLVLLSPYVDVTVLQTVDRRCAEQHIPSEQRKVALEAARWIALHRASTAVETPEDLAEQLPDEDVAAEMLRKADRETFFYADVYRVVALTLGRGGLPRYSALPKGKAWQHRLARLLREILDSRQQQLASPAAQPGGVPIFERAQPQIWEDSATWQGSGRIPGTVGAAISAPW